MSTKRDWIFRADYLRMQAENSDRRAYQLRLEAERYRMRAHAAQTIADDLPDEPEIVVS